MPVKTLTATTAARLPTPFWHIGMTTTHRSGPDLAALPSPYRVVAMFGTDQRMSNLVQERVTNLVQWIGSLHQMD
jgi:hypothetical protein